MRSTKASERLALAPCSASSTLTKTLAPGRHWTRWTISAPDTALSSRGPPQRTLWSLATGRALPRERLDQFVDRAVGEVAGVVSANAPAVPQDGAGPVGGERLDDHGGGVAVILQRARECGQRGQ